MPIYHIYALTSNLLTFAHLGIENVLITNPRDLSAFVRELARHSFSFLSGVNTLFDGLLATPAFDSLDFRSLQICLGGGTAVKADTALRWQRTPGVAIAQGYGLTEASPMVTGNPMDSTELTGSIGLPLPSTEVAIIDDADRELGFDETGEICVRGPQVMPGISWPSCQRRVSAR